VSASAEVGNTEDWHEAASVTITRLVCQLLLSVGVLFGCLWITINHPEDTGGAALAAGVILGAWFGIVREPTWRSKR
jgi:hypothetical protein